MEVYRVIGVEVVFPGPAGPVHVMRGVDLTVPRGRLVAITGPSGSGKSTLLQLMSGLRRPTSGSVLFEGIDLAETSPAEAARTRNRRIGMVFQAFHLVPHLTALENVALPLWIAGASTDRARRRAAALLDRVGLAGRARHRPRALSGGEQQRVAIARALANDPAVVLADEPTGNLDSGATASVVDTLRELNRRGRTVVVATHDQAVAREADERWVLREGVLYRLRA